MDHSNTNEPKITGLFLAGGQSRRMGRPKGQIMIGDRTLAELSSESLRAVSDEILIVAPDPLPLAYLGDRMTTDLWPGTGPLGALATGLFFSRHPLALITPCDAPSVHPGILKLLIRTAKKYYRGQALAVIPETPSGRHPLLAVYAQKAWRPALELLKQNQLKVDTLYRRLDCHIVTTDELIEIDPGLRSFINLNTPAELENYLKQA